MKIEKSNNYRKPACMIFSITPHKVILGISDPEGFVEEEEEGL